MVADIIEHNKTAITALCRKHRVRALWVFGSATTDAWNPETSDLDFLVDLGIYDDRVHRRYFGLLLGLEDLLGRPIDLLTVKSIDNPYLWDELEETRKLVYGPADAEVAA